jgi:DNA modification methylase
MSKPQNILYYGDNITIMQEKMGKDAVDLIYLDPPFKSDTNYNLMYKNLIGKPVPEQVVAFSDTWELDAVKEEAARHMPVLMKEHGVPDYYVDFWRLWMNALRHTNKELLAYLIYMVQRLLYMKSILRPHGSIYLHCDPAASHYIKVMMDAIFGHENFRNEIIWKRTGSHGGSKRWGPVHDTILFYTKSDKYIWNRVFQDYDQSYLDDFYRFNDEKGRYRLVTLTGAGVRSGDSGKPWRGVDPTTSGRHWALPMRALEAAYPDQDFSDLTTQEKLDLLDKAGLIYWPPRGSVPQQKRYADENPGVLVQDIITDIGPISSQSKERLGYPTQKPIALLDRIIQASTNKGDIVFDPFCGCGTTIYSAEKNERKWYGCDIAILPIRLVRDILTGDQYRLVEGVHFKVDGIPVSVEQAELLHKKAPFQFQTWFVERIGGFPMHKQVADRGIDGRMYFETKTALKEVMLSVKGGNLRPTDVRDLRGVMEREGSAMGALLTLKEPSKAMREEAARAGMYEYGNVKYPRLQILTVREVLEEKRELQTPTKVGSRIVASAQDSLPL